MPLFNNDKLLSSIMMSALALLMAAASPMAMAIETFWIVLGAASHSLSRLNKRPWLRVIAGTLVILLGAWYLISLFSTGAIQHSHH